jgi:hypothetical protein
MKKCIAPLLAFAVSLPACQGPGSYDAGSQPTDGVTVSFREIQNDVAYFDIKNTSQEDIDMLKLEIDYLDSNGITVKLDTVSYVMAADSAGMREPFLKSGSETFIVQSIEPGTTRATARRIE